MGGRLALAALLVAASISAGVVTLSVIVLRSQRALRSLTNLPAVARSLLSGLLVGLGLCVMLPLAVAHCGPGAEAVQHVLLLFGGAPMIMFFFNHIVLQHSHGPQGHPAGDASDCLECSQPVRLNAPLLFCPPVGMPTESTKLVGWTRTMSFGPKSAKPIVSPAKADSDDEDDEGASPRDCASAASQWASVLLRCLPYTVHASVDGALLGTASSPMMLASLALSVAFCSVQDVGTILASLGVAGATYRVKLVTCALFGAGFPLGTACSLALAAASTASASDHAATERALSSLRAFAAGLFVYMALFELAPPHGHGRLQNLRLLLAFAAGVSIAYLSDSTEDWVVTHMAQLYQPAGASAAGGSWGPPLHVRAAVEATTSRAASAAQAAQALLPY